MTSARKPEPRPEPTLADVTSELLQRRAVKRKSIEAPTSSPFYDAEFVAENRKKISRKQNYRKSDPSSSGS